MSQYTESQLNAKNKTQLVELAIQLGNSLYAATSGPLTSADVEKQLLDLKRQTVQIADNAVKRQQEHEKDLAQIAAKLELDKAKLELEYNADKGADAINLDKLFKDLEARAKAAADDLTFGLEKAEIETGEKIAALTAQYDEAKANYETAIAEWEKRLTDTKTTISTEISDIKTSHNRQLEQIRYDNSIALRDENLKAAEAIAGKFSKVIVDKDTYDALVNGEKAEASDIAAQIDAAVNASKKEVYVSEGAKYSALKSSTDAAIALLEKDKTYLSDQIVNQNARIVSLEAQIKAFPEQLAKAVEAAKADVTINQDNKK